MSQSGATQSPKIIGWLSKSLQVQPLGCPPHTLHTSALSRCCVLLQAAVCCTAGNSSHSKTAASAAADSEDDWDTGKGKAGKGKRGKSSAKGKKGGGSGGGGGGRASNGVSQPGGDDGGQKLLSAEVFREKLLEWCPDLEEGPPDLVRSLTGLDIASMSLLP